MTHHRPAPPAPSVAAPRCPPWCRSRHPERSIPGQVWCVHEHRTYDGTHGSAHLSVCALWPQRVDGRHPYSHLETPHVEVDLHTPAGSAGPFSAQLTPPQANSLAAVVEAVADGDPELAEGLRAAAHLIASALEE